MAGVGMASGGGGAAAEIDESNRWAELENAQAALIQERDALREELEQRRKVEQALATSRPSASPALSGAGAEPATGGASSEELEKLKTKLAEASSKLETSVGDLVAERSRSAALAKELESKALDMASLSEEKLRLHFETSKARAQLGPLRAERERLKSEAAESAASVEELQGQVSRLREEALRSARDRASAQRELEDEASAAKADAAFQEQVAEEAREGQRRARQRAAELEQELRDRAEDFAEERARIENQLHLKTDQLARATEDAASLRRELSEALEERDAALKVQAASTSETSVLEERASDLQGRLAKLEDEHEALLRQCIPGAADAGGLPPRFASVAELVREAEAAREEAGRERRMREQLEEAMQEVEREVRSRFPALMTQKEDNERYQSIVAQLSKDNEELLKQLGSAQAERRASEGRARKAERSEKVLEAHARDLTRQLAVLVHQNQKLSSPAEAIGASISELEDLEKDRTSFRTVQDLTEQNHNLKKALARLRGESDTAAQRELQELRDEKVLQEKDWKKHLAEKAEQMKVLAEAVAKTAKERDEARRRVTQLEEEKPSQPPSSTAVPAASAVERAGSGEALVPRERLDAVKAELQTRVEELRAEVQGLRGSERKALQDLSKAQEKLGFESGRSGHLSSALEQRKKELDEVVAQQNRLQQRNKALEEGRRKGEEASREREAQLAQVRQEQAQLEKRLRLERGRKEELEREREGLVADQAAQVKAIADSQAQLAREGDLYKELKRNAEAAFKRDEQLLREKLLAEQQRLDDAKLRIEALLVAQAAGEAQASEARESAASLKEAKSRLEAQVAQQAEELRELRSGAPSSAASGAAGAEAPGAEDLERLEQRLRFAEERERERLKSAEMWKSMVAAQEADLKTKQDEVGKLRAEVAAAVERGAKAEGEMEQARQREQTLEARVEELSREGAELRAAVDARSAEVASAQLEGEEKARKAALEVEKVKNETEAALTSSEEWKVKYNRVVQDHSRTIKELQTVQMRQSASEKEAKELRARTAELSGEAARARAERADEVEALQGRLEHEVQRSQALSEETKKYQEHLLALASAPGRVAGGEGEAAATAAKQRVAAELAKARELGEKRWQVVESERLRWEREAKALRSQVDDLQTRLSGEQREVLRLQAEVRDEQRAISKLGQLGLIEDENRRLADEARSLETQLVELRKEREAARMELEPLAQSNRDYKKKEEEWERARKALEASVDEWKKLHTEAALRFDAKDASELKKLKEDSAKWQASRTELIERVQKLQEDLKRRSQEAEGSLSLRTKNDELQKAASDAAAQVDQLTKEKAKLREDVQAAETMQKRSEALKTLRDQMIERLEKKIAEIEQERNKLQDDVKSAVRQKGLLEAKEAKERDAREVLERQLREARAAAASAAATATGGGGGAGGHGPAGGAAGGGVGGAGSASGGQGGSLASPPSAAAGTSTSTSAFGVAPSASASAATAPAAAEVASTSESGKRKLASRFGGTGAPPPPSTLAGSSAMATSASIAPPVGTNPFEQSPFASAALAEADHLSSGPRPPKLLRGSSGAFDIGGGPFGAAVADVAKAAPAAPKKAPKAASLGAAASSAAARPPSPFAPPAFSERPSLRAGDAAASASSPPGASALGSVGGASSAAPSLGGAGGAGAGAAEEGAAGGKGGAAGLPGVAAAVLPTEIVDSDDDDTTKK